MEGNDGSATSLKSAQHWSNSGVAVAATMAGYAAIVTSSRGTISRWAPRSRSAVARSSIGVCVTLTQTGRFGPSPRTMRKLLIRRAAEQTHGTFQNIGGEVGRPTGKTRSTFADQCLEHRCIDLCRVGGESVAGFVADDHPWITTRSAERRSQPRSNGLQRSLAAQRFAVIFPNCLDEPVDGHGMASVADQHAEQGTLTPRAEQERCLSTPPDRTKHPEPHECESCRRAFMALSRAERRGEAHIGDVREC